MEFYFSPIALLITAVGGGAVLFAPRRYALGTLMLVALFLPMANRVVVGGIDLMGHRLLVLAGVARVMFRGEYRDFAWHLIDKVMLAMGAWSVVAYSVLWADLGSFIYSSGRFFDIVGRYFLFRFFLREPGDWDFAARALVVGCVVFAAFMSVEALTGRNLLAALGGLDEEVWARKGRLRCRATFGHAISAGVFGASLVPLWLAALLRPGFRIWGKVGLGASMVMVLTSASSSSLLTLVAGVGAFSFWPLRAHLRAFRWGVCLLLIGLHMVMTAPVWALLGRINIVGGSTGSYRYRLVDSFIKSFDQWWLIGLKDPMEAFGMWDLCNQFVLEGIRGGLARLVLFSAVLALCFREVGRTIAFVEDRRALWFWALGSMLFAHFAAFWGYDYWDQIRVALYLVFAAIASAPVIVGAGGEEDPLPRMEEDLSIKADEWARHG